ncbi:procathepsin L-like isoform X2 [Carcharodon carcharias]|uniref:procathepsin L-like isoform X2 n=1 Tax=Carcharodon carcharias TaxID=13397 RepID=UPI001B7E5C9C|nr:procathepsin L-like isoform X2 [Carcharodon carcharias]
MKLSLFLACVLVSTLVVASGHIFDSRLDEDWKNWKSQHEKHYTEEEETYRRMVWEDHVRFIEQHNLEYSMGKQTFTVGMNQFGDMTTNEFNELMNRFLPVEADNSTEDEFDEEDEHVEDEHVEDDDEFDEDEENDDDLGNVIVDWRTKGYVTPVKNQDQNCQNKTDKLVAKIRHYAFIRRRERFLEKAVERIGPISVAIDASGRSFHFYKRGIYRNPRCKSRAVNHAVLVVGFGREDQRNYWLIKNSWGTSWGHEGYIKMAKNVRRNCGITRHAVYPIV